MLASVGISTFFTHFLFAPTSTHFKINITTFAKEISHLYFVITIVSVLFFFFVSAFKITTIGSIFVFSTFMASFFVKKSNYIILKSCTRRC
jgi:hypothetical protein